MSGAEEVREEIALFGKLRAGIVIREFAGVESDDAAHAEMEDIGVEGSGLLDEALGIEGGVGFAEIGLNPADGFGQPPALLGVEGGRKEEKREEEHAEDMVMRELR